MKPTYDWDEAYEAAILETDPSKLKARIEAARNAINHRFREMNANHDGSPEERFALLTARIGLGVLRKRTALVSSRMRERVSEPEVRVKHVERRRSARLPRNVTFVVSGESKERQPFQERALTLSVNAHGALIALTTQVKVGQKLLLTNLKTWIKREARAIRLGALHGHWTPVVIEFAQSAPEFWPDEDDPPKRTSRR